MLWISRRPVIHLYKTKDLHRDWSLKRTRQIRDRSIVIPHFEADVLQSHILRWFEVAGRYFPWRKKTANNYYHVISEVLLQRTQAETVAKFWPSFIKDYPSWKRLSQATEVELQECLKPVGLWRRRAASLYLLAQEMERRRGRFPRGQDEIESLPGVGQYLANAILLFCYNEHRPLLDSNMARVLERVFGPRELADIRDDLYLQSLAKQIVDCKESILINWAILDLAALICKIKTPLCSSCPLSNNCRYARFGK